MAYNERLAQRLSGLIQKKKGFAQMKMFGGIGFLLNGNMCVGVYKDYLIVRLGPLEAQQALKNKHVKKFDITGRAMRGWAMVHANGTRTEPQLQRWLKRAMSFVKTLPPKI